MLQDIGVFLMLGALAAGFLQLLDAIARRVQKTMAADSDGKSRELFQR
jgi:hypothetical protein